MNRSLLLTPAARFMLAAGAASVAAWSVSSQVFRNPDHTLASTSAFPLALAAALGALGISVGTRWLRVGAWTSLLIASQGAALQLIDAPNAVVYQHYRLGEAFDAGAVAIPVLILLLQAVVVLRTCASWTASLSAWWRDALPPWARAILVLVFVLTSAALSRAPVTYLEELVVASLVQLVALLNTLCIARALPDDVGGSFNRLLRPRGTPERDYRAVEPFSVALAVWVFAISALLAVAVYERHPHVPDEVVYLLQARYLAHGMLTLPLPPVPEAFNLDLMYSDATRWFSPVPPGWPFALAIGAWLGTPWLVNPFIGAICVLLANGVLAELYPARTRRTALLLLAASPWFLFMSMNFMTHQLTLAAALGAALAVARARRRPKERASRMFVGGLCIGIVSLIRPLEGLGVALLLGLWSLPMRGGLFRFASSAWLVAGSAVTGLLVRPYNALMTGDPSKFPIMAYIDKYYAKGANDLGFGPNRGLSWAGLDPFPGHGARDVVVNANLNLFSINTDLFGWALGSLGVVAFLLVSRRMRREDWYMATVIAVIAGLHSFYWFSGGPDFAARYWYLVLIPCVALSVRGIEELSGSAAGHVPDAPARATTTLLLVTVVAMLTFVPWRAISKYHHYRNMRPDVRELAQTRHFGRSLVLVRGNRHPDYSSAAIYNPLDLRADAPIYVWDTTREVRSRVLAEYPGRPVWVVNGTTITHGRFEVVAGPLTTLQAMELP
jgi:predicted secreted protein